MLARIYWIYTHLKSEARPSVAQFMQYFEMSRSTFKRDIEFLKDRLGAPVAYDPVGNGYYLTDRSFELPAFWFDRRHLLMMLGACRQLAAMSDAEPTEIRRFRRRVEDLLTMHYGDLPTTRPIPAKPSAASSNRTGFTTTGAAGTSPAIAIFAAGRGSFY